MLSDPVFTSINANLYHPDHVLKHPDFKILKPEEVKQVSSSTNIACFYNDKKQVGPFCLSPLHPSRNIGLYTIYVVSFLSLLLCSPQPSFPSYASRFTWSKNQCQSFTQVRSCFTSEPPVSAVQMFTSGNILGSVPGFGALDGVFSLPPDLTSSKLISRFWSRLVTQW